MGKKTYRMAISQQNDYVTHKTIIKEWFAGKTITDDFELDFQKQHARMPGKG